VEAETRAAFNKLSGDLDAVQTLAQKKDWEGLGQHLQQKLPRSQFPGEVGKTLDLLDHDRKLILALSSLDEQLSRQKLLILADATLNDLPSPVRKAVAEAADLEGLETALAEKWPQQPDLGQLERRLATYAAGAKNPGEIESVRLALAKKADAEGYAETARKLLPERKPLRDLEKVPPVDGTSQSGVGKNPPSEVAGVVPEAGQGVAAAPRQTAGEGLPPLERVKEASKQARQRAADRVHDELEVASHHLHLHLHTIHDYSTRAKELAEGKDDQNRPGSNEKPEAAVAKALGRPLTATDRLLLQGMQNRGMKTAEIVAKFRELEADGSK